MKDKIAIVLLGLLFNASLMAQGFMKSYHIDGSSSANSGNDIIVSNGYLIFTVQMTDTNLQSTGAIKTEINGTIENKVLYVNPIGNLLPTKEVEKINSNNIVIAGAISNPDYLLQFFFLQVNDHTDSIRLLEYGNLEKLENTIQICVLEDTIFCSISYGDFSNSYSNEYLLKLDTCFTVLEEVPLDNNSAYSLNYTTALAISKDSLGIYIATKNTNNLIDFYRKIIKTDKNGNILWAYVISGNTSYVSMPVQIEVLQNGNIITRWFDENSNGQNNHPYLICLNSDGEFVWRYDFDDNYYEKSPTAMQIAANGDIIGCGYTQNPSYNYNCAWLFRISSEGQLLWEREYVSKNNNINFLNAYAVNEDLQNSIVATGLIIDALPNGGVEGNALLLKVLPNGCFTPNCNGGAEDTLIVASTVTGINSPIHPLPPPKEGNGRLVVFPNPANNQLQVLLPNLLERQNATLQLIDLQGRVLKSATLPTTTNSPFVNLSTTELPNGMYVLTYTVLGVVQARAKVVVNHATN